ncbi:ketopantoate reductase PanE/ApbA C terminal-domain-containing protein [Colletotrichum navitas]|uniref:Ketopantoate reductase PanE/ApbA C terminal-domain-containing protein n=1 Tax=Colletotrichum navitas TaxID=681940 RepID=A0AAD8QC49_9PEZI|nr:ketopantoate reductase PanE/ApbA C terminal-domain-containing protein [Colletotrichum navitas]KAK1598977.1 ketopantoate reductase PanE/ApbA C terminal-domain-containing protein [Colletotrichum navitas]
MSPAWLQSFLNATVKEEAPRLYVWNLSNLEGQTQPFGSTASSRPDELTSYRHEDNLNRRVYILGVGNLGTLFASSLASLPEPPPITLVVHRKDLLLSWREQPGIEITRGDSIYKHLDFDVELWSEEPPSTGLKREVAEGQEIHNLIVATKASQALPAVDRICRYLNETSTIAFAQNGMCKLWPPHGKTYAKSRYLGESYPNFLACVTTHGVTSLGRFKSFHASEANLKIGPVLLNKFPEKASYLLDVLCRAPTLHGEKVTQDELWILQLEKLVVNSIINPLTAILRCKNGDLFIEKEGVFAELINALLLEASNVLQALIKDRSTDAIIRPASREATFTTKVETDHEDIRRRRDLLNRFSQPQLREMLYSVGNKVKDNTSSMLQDVRAGKQTEIDEFNGWLVEMATCLNDNLDITHHRILIDLVHDGNFLPKESLVSYFPSWKGSNSAAV